MLKKLLVFTLSLLTLASCTQTEEQGNNELTKKQSYSYTLTKEDINSNQSSFKKNGLSWAYTTPTYLGFEASKGIQIGSSKRPESSFTIECNFKENVIINDYNIELSVGSSGSAECNVSYGNETNYFKLTNTTVDNYSKLNLNTETTSFKIKLSAEAKAMYIKSISLSLLTSEKSKLNLIADSNEEILTPVEPGKNGVPAIKFTPLTNIDAYYKSFDLTKKGEALRIELDTKNDLKNRVSYGDARYMLLYTDESLTTKGKVYGIYDDKEYKAEWENGSTWNREHVWACNHMTHTGNRDLDNSTIDHKSDLHNLRVSTSKVNSSRGDNYFNDIKNSTDFFPNVNKNDHRGDVARILFYMYCNYDFLFLNDNPASNIDFAMGYLSVLQKWHNEDPVDDFEKQRNERIYQYQGNRNPFIDYPSLANSLFN